ncbi:MAG: triose-phosphate isomerase [Archaeoglobaceae archaeon]|nr:triose-phosphate isomerase [Archaeoglobaceae archaeon]MCX8151942.1 triose-phosphate isomerase [Archaeoglobaceae archaeon]MDW8013331.1 triose-phosphate isomerase [Archaeoglobaceae archaeon]
MSLIVINFKAYKEGFGKNALKLAKIAEDIASRCNEKLALAVSFLDLPVIVREVNLDVFAQHVDPISFGSFTGKICPEMLKEVGAKGSLINHSENRMKLSDIEFVVSKMKELDLISIVCTNNATTTAAAAALDPDFVAVEPPELIGTGISVSKARPEVVSRAVEVAKKVNSKVKVLCGAGISSREDYLRALELGAEGVLLASGVVKAKDQKKALEELVGL